MEQPKLTRVENAARDYADARDARIAHGEEEQRRHAKLLAVMEAEGLHVYKHRSGSEVIEVKVAAKDATKKAKVKIYQVDEEPATPQGDDEPPATDLTVEGGEPGME